MLTGPDNHDLVKLQAAADAAPSAMVSVIGLDSDKVAELCEAANAEVSEEERVQIANFLCPVCERNTLFLFKEDIVMLLWALQTYLLVITSSILN